MVLDAVPRCLLRHAAIAIAAVPRGSSMAAFSSNVATGSNAFTMQLK